MRKKSMSKFTSIVLSLLMVISMLPQLAFATPCPTVWNGTTDTSWYNETDTSFTITTAEQLAGLAELVNGGNNFTNKTITLGADIQLNNTTGWENWDNTYAGNQWTPIGNTTSNKFNGTFDGDNHTISGLYIYTLDRAVGLFGSTYHSSTIKNVKLSESYIYMENQVWGFVGGIVGSAGGPILNCSNSGTVYGTYDRGNTYVGGIAGMASRKISNCVNQGKITAIGAGYYTRVGGIAGSASYTEEYSVTNCYNSGAVTGDYNAGGIVGEGHSISDCYNTGTVTGVFSGGIISFLSQANSKVTNCYNAGQVNGTVWNSLSSAGGIVADNGNAYVTNCYNEGAISGDFNVGGIIGWNRHTVANCYNRGTVSGNHTLGGVVGYNDRMYDTTPTNVSNCYNLGNVSGTSDIGSIAGKNTFDESNATKATTITNCYWLDGTSTVAIGTETAESSGIVSMLSADMKAPAFIDTLNANAEALTAANESLKIVGWKFIAGKNNDYPVYQEPLTGTASITGNAVWGSTLTASLSDSNSSGILSYQWVRSNYSGDESIEGATGKTYMLTADDIFKKVTVQISGSEQWGSISSAATASVQKADCEITEIVAPVTTEVTSSSITVKEMDGYQYVCVPSGETSLSDWWEDSNVFTGLSSNKSYDLYHRVPQTSTHKASNPSAKLTVTTGLGDNWTDYVVEPRYEEATKTYTIATAGELAWISKQVNEDVDVSDYTYNLTADIDLSEHLWAPIAHGENMFSGIFNGNGHTISNIKLDVSEQMFCGLFGLVSGEIKDVSLNHVSITGNTNNRLYVGALVVANMGIIQNSSITNCTMNVTCSDEAYIGGLCGINEGLMKDCTVSACSIRVNGIDEATCTAGIFCGASMGALVNCYADGLLEGSAFTVCFGGLSGKAEGSIYSSGAHGTVRICENANRSYAGGLVGEFEEAVVYNSYANVMVNGDDGSKTGGLIGIGYAGEIHNCVSYGAISVPSAASTTHLGGLIGNNSSDDPCTYSNSYWNREAPQSYCGVERQAEELVGIGNYSREEDASNTNYTGKTMAELKSQAFLKTLNDYVGIENTKGTLSNTLQAWKMITSNDGFPGFKEMKSTAPETPNGGSSHTSSGGGNSNVRVPDESPVEVNGQKQDAGTASTQTSGGKTVTTIKVDDTKLNKLLESSKEKPTVTLPASKASEVVIGELNGQTVKNMETKEANLEIKTDMATYNLPASHINIDAVSSQIGSQVELKDIKVSVKIAEPAADTVKVVEDTAKKNSYQLVVKPVEFEITCTSGSKTVAVSKFNGYVERTIAIPDGVDPSKITTGVVLNADRTFRHVPTEIIVINGKHYAKINSLTNSTYSVIWNPIEFTDVENHWAKDSVNDMGSRMVVTGVADGSYEPDRSITRAEFAAIVVRAMGLGQGKTESSFGDVSQSDWFNGYVDTATAYKLINGYSDVSYGPNKKITREQAMTIIARAMKTTGLEISVSDAEVSAMLSKFTDALTVSEYAKNGIAACVKSGVVTGTSKETLSPRAYVTRAEVAVMVQNLLQQSGLI